MYPASTTTVAPDQTIYYTQAFQITGSSTTITTELPLTTVIPATASFSVDLTETRTADFSFLNAYVQAHGTQTSTAGDGEASSDNASSSSSQKSNTATIAGSVVGSVVAVSIILWLLLSWLFKKRRRGRSITSTTSSSSRSGGAGAGQVEDKSFTHEISSTRRYGGANWDGDEEEFQEKNIENDTDTDTGLASIRSSILHNQDLNSVAIPSRPLTTTATSLSSSKIPIIPPRRPADMGRTIDTVFEDSESSSSSNSNNNNNNNNQKSQQRSIINSRSASPPVPIQKRYHQNAGLKINPFDPATQRYTGVSKSPSSSSSSSPVPAPAPVPVPPPPRKNNNKQQMPDEYQRQHGNNRESTASLESSLLSEDTTDDISSDESLLRFGEDGMANSAGSFRGGFFKEVV